MESKTGFLQVGSRVVDRRGNTNEDLEQEADGILRKLRSAAGLYNERRLERKIRLEKRRLPVVDEIGVPGQVIDYLLARQIELMLKAAGLTRLQKAAIELTVMGWSNEEIAEGLNIPLFKVKRSLKRARRKISRSESPLDGLYEVYWSETHRYVYRKGR